MLVKNHLYGVVFLLMTSAAASADPVKRVTLPALLAAARKSPSVEIARARAHAAEAKVDEVGNAWIPQIEITAVGGPSPEITCTWSRTFASGASVGGSAKSAPPAAGQNEAGMMPFGTYT